MAAATNLHNLAVVIGNEVTAAQRVREALTAEGYGDDIDLLLDSVEGQTQLLEVLSHIVDEAIPDAEMMIVGIKKRQDDLKARRSRYEMQIEKLRAMCVSALTKAGLPNFRAASGTVGRRDAPIKLVITDETRLPRSVFVQPPQPPLPPMVVDMDLLKAAMEAADARLQEVLNRGEEPGPDCSVPGAEWSNPGQILTIRRA